MSTARPMTRASLPPSTIASTTWPASTGVATVSRAATTLSSEEGGQRPAVRAGEAPDAAAAWPG